MIKRLILWACVAALATFVAAVAMCTRPTIWRFDVPMSREEALKSGFVFPFPEAARNIQFATCSRGFAYEWLVKFEAPVSVCEQHVDEVLKHHDMPWNSSGMPKQEALGAEESDHVEYSEFGMLKPTPWFDPDSIKRCLHVGRPGCSTPEFWIDREKGVFYFRLTD